LKEFPFTETPMTFLPRPHSPRARRRRIAQRYFAAAAPSFRRWVRDDPADPNHHAQLGLLYAYMQRKEDALREARRAVELEPESQNAFHGAVAAGHLALVCAFVGEEDQAITLIERLLSTPGPVQGLDQPQNITLRRVAPALEWDSLRRQSAFPEDPRRTGAEDYSEIMRRRQEGAADCSARQSLASNHD